MTLRAAFRAFVAPRTTLAILAVLAFLLLLLVAVPQARTVGPETFARIAAARPSNRFLLVDLGLGDLPTSPIFLGALGLFFVNLAAVLAARVGPTWRRAAMREPNEKGLAAWARLEESLAAALPSGWSAARAADTLRGFGYRVRRPGERTLWGVKHRTAPLGFLLFHASFFLLCAGGALLYYTRFHGSAVLTEGQAFEGQFSTVERMPRIGGPPALRFTAVDIDPRRERGEPVHLSARLRFEVPGAAPVERPARVNAPAHWGSATLLVNEAGLSPVLWLQDANGFTVDRIAVPVRATPGAEPTELPLADGRLRARLFPLGADEPFPGRDELSGTAVRVELLPAEEETPLFDGRLRAGEAADVGDLRLLIAEMRYWVRVVVVAERGGGLLEAGFALGILGVAWRLFLYRREVALAWDGEGLRLVGRAEYFTHRFRRELAAIRDTLAAGPDADTTPEEP